MKAYLLKTIGIIVIATLAGVAHFALGDDIRFAKGDLNNKNEIPSGAPSDNSDSLTQTPENSGDESASQEGDSAEEPVNEGAIDCSGMILETEITSEQARCLFENDLAIFIDARPSGDYERGHIAGSFSVPMGAFENGVPIAVDMLDDQRFVVIYCSGGNCEESHLVAEDLAIERPDLANMIHIYVDGYPAWEDAGLPIEDGPDPFAE
ncbi:MAG: hypothetical protein ED559_03905 [Phycisphaera sp.]|nr:MAG: hypothetical protein ED559_03905 [Phycisphaera sp.]